MSSISATDRSSTASAASARRCSRKPAFPLKEKLDWTTKNARATAQFLAHTIETAETMIAFELACRAEGAPALIDHHDLLPYLPEETRDEDAPFHIRVPVKTKRDSLTIGVVPDRVFSLALPNSTRFNFALELDRGTMDIKSRQLVGKSSYRRKLLGYYQLWREGLHTKSVGLQILPRPHRNASRRSASRT